MNVAGGGYGGLSGAQLQQQMGMEQGRRVVTNGSEEPSWVASLVGGKEGSSGGMARAPSAPVGGFGLAQQQQQQNQPGFAQTRWPDGQGYIPLEFLQQQQQAQLLSLASTGYGGQPQLQMQMQGQPMGPHSQGMGGFKMPLNYNPQQGGGYLPPPGSAQGYQMPLHMGNMPNMPNMPLMGIPPMTPNSAGFAYPHTPQAHTPIPSAHHFGPQDQAVIELARAKGLNPATFDCQPPMVRLSPSVCSCCVRI
jgi:hypothetical protein